MDKMETIAVQALARRVVDDAATELRHAAHAYHCATKTDTTLYAQATRSLYDAAMRYAAALLTLATS